MRRSILALLAVFVVPLIVAQAAESATITEADTLVRFQPGCEGTGFYVMWNRTIYPAVEELLSVNPPVPITWSSASPIDIGEGSGASPGQELVLLLFDEDLKLLFEGEYDLAEGPNGVLYFRIDVTLDCSVVPYREILLTEKATAGPEQSGLPLLLGLIALTFGSLLAFRAGGRHLGHDDRG